MTQTLIAFLLVAWATTYSFGRLMPNAWRRKLRQTVAPFPGFGPGVAPDAGHSSSCGNCTGCNGCD